MMSNSDLIFQSKLHWIIFFLPTVLSVGSLVLDGYLPVFHLPALVLLFLGVCWFLVTAVTYRVSSLSIESNQLVLSTGFLVRQTVNIPLKKIESIDIRQPILGSLLNFGTLVITGTGGTRYSVDHIAHPLTCRRHIEGLIKE